MQKLLLFTLFTVLAFSAAAEEYTEEENVLVLGDKNIAQAIQEFENILVEFYAPWCGHCKHLAPEYAKAAASLKESGSNIKLAKVDSTVEHQAAIEHDVQGYPTLIFFHKGEPITYTGGRTSEEILKWLNKKTQPAVREATSSEQLKKELEEGLVIVFWGDKDSASYGAFETASKKFEDVSFFATNSQELKNEHKVSEGAHVLLLKNFDEGRNELNKAFDLQELLAFIEENRYPMVLPFGEKAVDHIFNDNRAALIVLVQNNEAGQTARATIQEVAPKLKGKILVSVSDIEDENNLGPVLAEFLGITPKAVPTVRILLPQEGEAPKTYGLEGDLTADTIHKLYEDFTAGKLSPLLKSEPIPETNDEPVKVVVGKSFESIVMDPTKDVFVEFYAPWCGHCQELAPVWEEVATSLSSISDLVLAKIDATANDVESVKIEGFPTLYLYPKGDKQNPILFEGDERTKASLLDFLKQKITVAHDPNVFSAAVPATSPGAENIEL